MGTRDEIDDIMFGVRGRREPETAVTEAAKDSEELDFSQLKGCYSTLPANKNLTRLHVVLGDGTIETFQYAHLDVKSRFTADGFVFTFAGTKFWELRVTCHGQARWRVYDLVSLHRMPYLRQAIASEAKFASKDEAILTKIEIVDVTPRERGE